MKVIWVLDIVLAYLLIFACAAFLVAGVFKPVCLIWALAALVAYILWSFLRLRCPWCGVSVDLTKLLRGVRKTCNCPNCGHEITVALYVRKAPPRKRSEPKNNR